MLEKKIILTPELANSAERVYKLNVLQNYYKNFLDSLPIYKGSGLKPKIIWWCWLQGVDNAPPICKACLNSLKQNISDHKIIVITEENRHDFIKLPAKIEEKYANGLIDRTHFSDILRAALLVHYGGTWIDSTVLCTARGGVLMIFC